MGESGDFMFMGEYYYTIDEKYRLTIPSRIRNDLGNDFILTRGLDGCLFIYPKLEWNNIISKYKELPNTQDARNFMRFFLSSASTCQLDKQGRFSISSPLIKYASIIKECVIIGVDDHLEIWSKERWEAFISDNEENLSQIAESLFTIKVR